MRRLGPQGRAFVWLLVDGTKVHLQGKKGKDSAGGDALGVGLGGRGKPFEPWVLDRHSWKSIRKDLAKRLNYANLRYSSPMAKRALRRTC